MGECLDEPVTGLEERFRWWIRADEMEFLRVNMEMTLRRVCRSMIDGLDLGVVDWEEGEDLTAAGRSHDVVA